MFRDGYRPMPLARLFAELLDALALLERTADRGAQQGAAERALLRAGELESVLCDRGAAAASAMAATADRLADVAYGGVTGPVRPPAIDPGAQALAGEARVSPPEGFAYYALQPAAIARLGAELPVASGAAAVIGLRSIGATLSAIVAAALRRRGVAASRTTVRPVGHPFDREVTLSAEQLAWIHDARDWGASFFVVDEGPGMSGSSLLAAGEAVVRAGVPRDRVVFVCSRAVDPASLCARDAARRFRAFGVRVAPRASAPDGAVIDACGGLWRARFCGDPARWPAVWPAMERAKALSADGRLLFKFEGLGRWGEEVLERARAIAAAGFGPEPTAVGGGFAAYPVIGRPLARGAIEGRLIALRIADYCAFRAAAFPAPDADAGLLTDMIRWDAGALGAPLPEGPLPMERPVIADARLHPHEWTFDAGGAIHKTDGAAHGDDHLLPGPVDIAWDLAGAVVEWELDAPARRALLDRYARVSGDRADARLAAYVRAYAVAQMARAAMAMASVTGTAEELRLAREIARYRRVLAVEDARDQARRGGSSR